MQNFRNQLLKYKFTIIIVALSLLAVFGLYVAEQYVSITPSLSNIIRSVVLAFLTSGVVSFVFEYLTRTEFTDLVREVVRAEVSRLERGGLEDEQEALFEFWKPFTEDGAVIVVAEDDTATEPVVRATDLETALALYRGLLTRYLSPIKAAHVRIDFIPKFRPVPDVLPFDQNLIIVAAPGANPLATRLLNELKGLPPDRKNISNGYVFAVEALPSKYLSSPYIISVDKGIVGIWELKKGKVIRCFERYIPDSADAVSHDCCLVVRGIAYSLRGRPLHILLIMGHSRYATQDGIEFILTNNDWARQVSETSAGNVESVLVISGPLSQKRKITLAQPPRPIQIEKPRSNE